THDQRRDEATSGGDEGEAPRGACHPLVEGAIASRPACTRRREKSGCNARFVHARSAAAAMLTAAATRMGATIHAAATATARCTPMTACRTGAAHASKRRWKA